MRIARTLPPAAAPIGWKNLLTGISAVFKGRSELSRFSGELKCYFGKPHCFLVSSGKAALTQILRALREQYPNRDEVIIPAYTCYSVPSAIVRAGLKVKLCDIAAENFDFNFEQLEPMLNSEKLLCVAPTHLFGLPADIKRLRGLIDDPDVTIIEDASQAMGGEWQGQKLGTLGDVGVFSLGRGKALSTVEGGVILTGRGELAVNLKRQIDALPEYTSLQVFKLFLYGVALNILLLPTFFWIPKSLPFLKLGETTFDPDFQMKKISYFQVGLTKNWIEKLRFFRQVRQDNIKKWLPVLDDVNCKVCLPNQPETPDLIRLPVRIEDEHYRIGLLAVGARSGAGISAVYPEALCEVPELNEMFKSKNFPEAKKNARELITFPVHPFVSHRDVDRIGAIL